MEQQEFSERLVIPHEEWKCMTMSIAREIEEE
jgi:hypothetical protein